MNSEYEALRQSKARRKMFHNLVKATFPCYNCGSRNMSKLHFHHWNPHTKMATIANITSSPIHDFEDLINEISKCMVLCRDCHSKVHTKKLRLPTVTLLTPTVLDSYGISTNEFDYHPEHYPTRD